jgi:hypothetical protein
MDQMTPLPGPGNTIEKSSPVNAVVVDIRFDEV